MQLGEVLELGHLRVHRRGGRSRCRRVLLRGRRRSGRGLLLLVRLGLGLLGVLLLLMVGDGTGGPGDDCGRGGGPDEATSASHHRD
jgi:hypothetical protein